MHASCKQRFAKEGHRMVQLVSSFDKCHYVTQACKKKKGKRNKEKEKRNK
jgi:hypothetical protein